MNGATRLNIVEKFLGSDVVSESGKEHFVAEFYFMMMNLFCVCFSLFGCLFIYGKYFYNLFT